MVAMAAVNIGCITEGLKGLNPVSIGFKLLSYGKYKKCSIFLNE